MTKSASYERYPSLNEQGLSPRTIFYCARQQQRQALHIARTNLRKLRGYQKSNFERLHGEYEAMLNDISNHDVHDFMAPGWQYAYSVRLKKKLLAALPFSFVGDHYLHDLYPWASKESVRRALQFLEEQLPEDRLQSLLAEDVVGEPELFSSLYLSSPWNILHLSYLIEFAQETRSKVENIGTVVEWGGGYGNMAKIVRRLTSSALTYVIIDSPRVNCVQWLYLATIFGRDDVCLIKDEHQPIHSGKINLLPISLLKGRQLRSDLFISTWALNESSKSSMDCVLSNNWFGARHLLLTFHGDHRTCPCSEEVGRKAVAAGARIKEIRSLPIPAYFALR